MLGLKPMRWARKEPEVFLMNFLRSARWFLLALVVFGVAAQQQANAQMPVGTTRTGTFVWDGDRWIPAEEAPPPPDADVSVGSGGVELTVNDAPPPMPEYVQPPCPEPNLIWTPGYWHHGFLGYYWVPGAWVPAPYNGALWTPGYWGFAGGRYGFHAGYWGPHVGFYGGVNYGGGYMGIGFAGGTWNNTAVVNVNTAVVTNVYVNRTIVQQTTIINTTNVSYNGGPNGVQHQPAPEEQIAAHETHTAPTTFQAKHVTAAAADKTNFASNNGGHPTNLAAAKPLAAETHAPPAGFKPPPPKPVSELAKATAPPETVAAAKTATTRTATVAKPVAAPPAKIAVTPPAKTVTPPPAKIVTSPPEKTLTPPPAKPAVTIPERPTPPPPAKPAVTIPERPTPPPPAKPAVITPVKPTPPPPAKPAVTPPAKPVTPPPAKPSPKPAPKPKNPPKPGEEPK
jgi:hypothetical protein